MDRAMTLNWLEMRRLSTDRVVADRPTRGVDSVAENLRLAQENERLRRRCEQLTASAETWIRLYECALARANASEARGTDQQEPRG